MARPFRMPGYPWLALAFVAVSAWIVAYAFATRPAEACLGLLSIAAGLPLYGHAAYRRGRHGRNDSSGEHAP